MATGWYKVTITEHDYKYTTYTAWVDGFSRNAVIAQAAAMAGQEKTRRAFADSGRVNDLWPEGLLTPEVKIEPCPLEEYWEKRNTVEVSSI